MNLQNTYLPVHDSSYGRADNSLSPLQAFLPVGLPGPAAAEPSEGCLA